MRKTGLLLAAGLLALFAVFQPATSLAETTSSDTVRRTIDVTGRATIQAKYDTANITFGVTALEETAPAAYSAVGEAAATVVDALKKQGIKEDDMKTGQLSLGAEYDWLKEGGQTLRGYRATTTLTVTTQELDKVAQLVQVAVANGANQLQGVSFSIKNPDVLADEALDKAVDDAKAKAERVAKRLGTSVVGVMRVSVMDSRSPVFYSEYAASPAKSADGAAAIPVMSGSGEVSATVSVTFELR